MIDKRIHTISYGFKRMLFATGIISAVLLLAVGADASKLVLRIQAANPTDEPRDVEVRSDLPERVTTNDVIDLAGLNLGYNVKDDSYYVYGTLSLAPREIAIRNVEIEDIWILDDDVVETLGQQASHLRNMLLATDYSGEANELADHAEAVVQEILSRQEDNRITIVGPLKHIQAYEDNLVSMKGLRQKVGRLENLVLSEGMNPGEVLMGEDRMAVPPRRDVRLPAEYGEATVIITVHNPSPTQIRRNVEIRRQLPREVNVEDVLDAAGLMVRYDSRTQSAYVYGTGLEVDPGETLTFNVRIRDKWNINGPRIELLDEMLSRLRATTKGRNRLEAVVNTLDDIESRLRTIREEEGPETFGPAYVAFYRRQADRLHQIEQDLNRVDVALRPLETRRGFRIPAPDRKTTWILIYAILGFLALLSLLFFLRWFVKSDS